MQVHLDTEMDTATFEAWATRVGADPGKASGRSYLHSEQHDFDPTPVNRGSHSGGRGLGSASAEEHWRKHKLMTCAQFVRFVAASKVGASV